MNRQYQMYYHLTLCCFAVDKHYLRFIELLSNPVVLRYINRECPESSHLLHTVLLNKEREPGEQWNPYQVREDVTSCKMTAKVKLKNVFINMVNIRVWSQISPKMHSYLI